MDKHIICYVITSKLRFERVVYVVDCKGYLFRAKQYLEILKQDEVPQILQAERDRHYSYMFEYPVLNTELKLNVLNSRFEGDLLLQCLFIFFQKLKCSMKKD
jgi:hypothetical protein